MNPDSDIFPKESWCQADSDVLCVQGNCNWAQWLLLSRLKGREYDASVANALTISAQNSTSVHELGVSGGLKSVLAAEGNSSPNRELMAVATLMYGPLPIQKCLVLGRANRQDLRSWQCLMEDLRPGLESFPSLWHTLGAACYGHDAWGFLGPPKTGSILSLALQDPLTWICAAVKFLCISSLPG